MSKWLPLKRNNSSEDSRKDFSAIPANQSSLLLPKWRRVRRITLCRSNKFKRPWRWTTTSSRPRKIGWLITSWLMCRKMIKCSRSSKTHSIWKLSASSRLTPKRLWRSMATIRSLWKACRNFVSWWAISFKTWLSLTNDMSIFNSIQYNQRSSVFLYLCTNFLVRGILKLKIISRNYDLA